MSEKTPPYKLDWDEFIDFVTEVDEIDVLETNPEETFIDIQNLNETPPLIVAEMFAFAHDCDVYVGAFDAERYGGSVTFHP